MKEQVLDKDKMSPELKKRLESAQEDIKNGNYKTFESVKKMFADMDRRRKWWHKPYYACCGFFDSWISPSTWMYRIHRWYLWFFKWGFNPKDIWSLDYTLSRWIIPRLTRLKETKHGVPSMVYGDEELLADYEKENDKHEIDNTVEDAEFKFNEVLWDFAMDKMIRAFELTIEDDWHDTEEYKKQQEEIQQGMKYFGKYFNCLWD